MHGGGRGRGKGRKVGMESVVKSKSEVMDKPVLLAFCPSLLIVNVEW